eukprot:3190135-Karenia_brevis.AAC.1
MGHSYTATAVVGNAVGQLCQESQDGKLSSGDRCRSSSPFRKRSSELSCGQSLKHYAAAFHRCGCTSTAPQ